MCRLYGFRSNEPTKVECTLVFAQNALLAQSRADQRGMSHADGWGIAWYEDGAPQVEKKSTAAYADRHFDTTAERMYGRTVVAHVRHATVGAQGPENCHPFVHGRWTFAHNGTVSAFQRVGPRLARATDPDFSALRCGSTDSEAAFLWLLTRLRRAGLERGCEDPGQLAALLLDAVHELDGLCAAEGDETPARLNFLLTDGRALVATRLRSSLYWVDRRGIHDCEICGIPHIHHESDTRYRAVVVASEPISHEDWREVPEDTALAVDPRLDVALTTA